MPASRNPKPTSDTDPDEPGTAALLADEALVDPDVVIEPPPDAPTLAPMAKINRRTRAEFFSAIQNLPLDEDGGFEIDGGSFKQAAAILTVMADVESALRMLAIDKRAFDQWALSASDSDLMKLFFWAFKEMKLGEAGASLT